MKIAPAVTALLVLTAPCLGRAGGFPIDAATVAACKPECVATDAQGALLCVRPWVEDESSPCTVEWVGPFKDEVEGGPVISVHGREEPSIDRKLIARMNARRGAKPLEPLFRFELRGQSETLRADGGKTTLVVSPDALTLTRAGFSGEAPLTKLSRGPSPGFTVTVSVYPYVAAVAAIDENLRYEPSWVPFVGPPAAPCPAKARCPASYEDRYVDLFERFCAGDLEEEHFLRQQEIDKDALVALFNLHGAFYGHDFKQERWLNDFYYGGGDWLPATCRSMIKHWHKAADVPKRLMRQRDVVRALWKERR